MTPAGVGESDILAIWQRMNKRKNRIPTAKAKFSIGQHVRISKGKMKFPKGAEQNFSTEIFKITKVVRRTSRPVSELEDLNCTPIIGKLYQEELTPVLISKKTTYRIDKILNRKFRNGIREVKVSWKDYPKFFNSSIPENSIKNIKKHDA
jgi:hypothetical protein